jgi:hypothetical protein
VSVSNVDLEWGTAGGLFKVHTSTPTVTPTATPTPTHTPTPTPWGPTPCASQGGWWASQGEEVPGNACWFYSAQYGWSCNSVCGGKGLRCVQANWNDDANVSICKHFLAENPQLKSTSARGHDPSVYPNSYNGYYGYDCCYRRTSGAQQNCAETTEVYEKRFCVCEPNP